jgi:hypothetical protein
MHDDLEQRLVALRPELEPTLAATRRARAAALEALPRKDPTTRRLHLPTGGGWRVTALAAAVVAIAAPAYAIATQVIDFWSQPPAPTVIKKRFEALFVTGAPPKMDPQAIPDETRLATTFTFSDQNYPLWVAPTATGHVCAEFLGFGGGCSTDVSLEEQLSAPPDDVKPWLLNVMVGAANGQNLLAGIITEPSAARLELVFSDGMQKPVDFVWVSDPINAGFFMAQLPTDPEAPQATVLRLFDGDGGLLAESHEVQLPPGPRGASSSKP